MAKNRIPRHIGFIPDGNRRWAQHHGLPKEDGYRRGIDPGLSLYEICMGDEQAQPEKYNLYLGLIYLAASVEQIQQDLEQIKQALVKRD
jgi:undecaprenyl diphosphate synthase